MLVAGLLLGPVSQMMSHLQADNLMGKMTFDGGDLIGAAPDSPYPTLNPCLGSGRSSYYWVSIWCNVGLPCGQILGS